MHCHLVAPGSKSILSSRLYWVLFIQFGSQINQICLLFQTCKHRLWPKNPKVWQSNQDDKVLRNDWRSRCVSGASMQQLIISNIYLSTWALSCMSSMNGEWMIQWKPKNHTFTQSFTQSSNLTLFQSYTLLILHSSNLPILCSSNLSLFQSYNLPILYSLNPTHWALADCSKLLFSKAKLTASSQMLQYLHTQDKVDKRFVSTSR